MIREQEFLLETNSSCCIVICLRILPSHGGDTHLILLILITEKAQPHWAFIISFSFLPFLTNHQQTFQTNPLKGIAYQDLAYAIPFRID